MSICFVVWGTGRTGGTRAIFEVVNRLSRRGFSVEIVALGGDHRWFRVEVPIRYVPIRSSLVKLVARLYHALRLSGVKPNAFTLENLAKRLGFHADLIRVLAEYVPSDCVGIATYYPTALALYLSSARTKLYFLQDFPELVLENDCVYGLRLFELTLRLPLHAFLCNSSYTQSLVKGVHREARTVVTGVGVDTSVFRPRSERIVDSRGRRVVMAIVRRARFKGGEVAIRALNLISERIPIHAILVGKKLVIEELLRRVEPRFTYDAFENVDDDTLAKLYSSADLFIYTSYAESFGLPPLEAMACGTPVVTTDCRGNRDYAKHEYNCLLTPPGDPHAIASAAIRVLKDDKLRKKLIEGGLETAKQWTWDKVVDRFEVVLKSLSP